MKKIFKTVISISLAAVLLCTAFIVVFAAKNAENAASGGQTEEKSSDTGRSFSSIEDVDETIQKIFHDNYDTIYQMAITLNKLNVKPEYYTYYEGSCGPTSKAFQKVLADNDIYVEVRKQNVNTETHAYNLLRISFDGGQTVKNIIIDTTYRQTLRMYFQQQCGSSAADDIDHAIEASGLPAVMVFEFGDSEGLDKKINDILSAKGLPHYEVSPTTNFYESRPYPEYELQATYDVFMTDQQIAVVQQIGKLNKPYDTELYLKSTTSDLSYPLSYADNGIYNCYISQSDFPSSYEDTFYVCDQNGTALYGAGEIDYISGYYSYYFSYMSRKEEAFLSTDTSKPFKLCCGSNDMMVRIDMRAGLDAPVIVLCPLNKYPHGDMNYDRRIDGNDAFVLKNAEQVPLNAYQRFSADFNEDMTLTDENLTMLRKYIVHSYSYPTGTIGKPFYEFSVSNNYFNPLFFE